MANILSLHRLLAVLLLFVLVGIGKIVAEEPVQQPMIIRFENHRFVPAILFVSAGRSLQIKVVNASSERIEFESFKLHREMVVEPGETVTFTFKPLPAGDYDFFDDFHEDVPEGKIVARKPLPPASR